MSCIRSLGRPLEGYLSIPVDKVEYTGIDYINPEGKVISTVIIDQDKRTIAVDVKELSSVPVSLLDPQPLTTQDGDFVLTCTIENAVRKEYKWLSYSDLLNRISTNENNIAQLKSDLLEEINRAKSIEEEINDKLDKEIKRAIAAEDTLTTNLNSEISNREDADKLINESINDLSDSLTKEVNRATEEENTISSNLNAHITNKENPHEVTKAQVGLDKVDNTADEDKPVSTATQNALNDLNTSLTNYVDNLIKSMGTLKGTLEEGTLEIGPGEVVPGGQVSN